MNALSPTKPPCPRRRHADGPFGQGQFQSMGDGAPLAMRGFMAIGVDMPGFGQKPEGWADIVAGCPNSVDEVPANAGAA